MTTITYGTGKEDDPWILKTPPQSSEFLAWIDENHIPPSIFIQVGKTKLSYHYRCIEDAHAMLMEHKDWMLLGNADEGKPTKENTLEAWARSKDNPIGGYYGLRKGYRGRFANYISPILETLGLVELEHNPRNNRIKAIPD